MDGGQPGTSWDAFNRNELIQVDHSRLTCAMLSGVSSTWILKRWGAKIGQMYLATFGKFIELKLNLKTQGASWLICCNHHREHRAQTNQEMRRGVIILYFHHMLYMHHAVVCLEQRGPGWGALQLEVSRCWSKIWGYYKFDRVLQSLIISKWNIKHFKHRKIHELNEAFPPLRESGRGRLPLATVLSRQRYFTFSVHLITCPANIQLWYPCRQWYCLPFCPLISHSWKIVVWQRCLAKFGCAIVNSFFTFL